MNFGIMQGRLTPSGGRGIQFFPFDNWEKEFYLAEELELQEIEWIFDYSQYENNPLWNDEGCKLINDVMDKTGVHVYSVCWDYFMRRPFFKSINEFEKKQILDENQGVLKNTLKRMSQIGARLLEIPLVDDSSMKCMDEIEDAKDFIRFCCDEAKQYNILIGLETDLPPSGPPIDFATFLDSLDRDNVRANFDSGNSSGIGYDAVEELVALDKYVQNVHVKDRVFGNGTVRLGTGSADFDKVFSTLKAIDYRGSYIMQAARGNDGMEINSILDQVSFVKGFLRKYGIEY